MDTSDPVIVAMIALLVSVIAVIYAAIVLQLLQRRRQRLADEQRRMLDELLFPDAPPLGKPRTVPSTEDLELRIAAIEARLPDSNTLHTIASTNEAVLAAKLEHIEKDLSRVESRLLGRGDVVLVMFGVLAALGVIVSLVSWATGAGSPPTTAP
jgi:hypothetical protein